MTFPLKAEPTYLYVKVKQHRNIRKHSGYKAQLTQFWVLLVTSVFYFLQCEFPSLSYMQRGKRKNLQVSQRFELSVHVTDGQVEATDLVCCQRRFYSHLQPSCLSAQVSTFCILNARVT